MVRSQGVSTWNTFLRLTPLLTYFPKCVTKYMGIAVTYVLEYVKQQLVKKAQ